MEARSLRQADDAPPPRVFLSYSHDSEEHSARVLALTQRLRRDGVDAHLDQFDPRPREGWPHWCARQILDADFVVLVCTATYRDRFFGYERPGIGRGVRWEAKIIKNIILGKMTLAPAEISERIAAAGREAGYTDDQFAALLKEMGD